MTEPRFGFDERVGNGQNSNSWQDVDWVDIGVDNGSYFGSAALQNGAAREGAQASVDRSARGDGRRRRCCSGRSAATGAATR